VNIKLKLKENVLKIMTFLVVLYLAEMTRSDISKDCAVQLYWMTVYDVGG
jgi:hypothetical protein